MTFLTTVTGGTVGTKNLKIGDDDVLMLWNRGVNIRPETTKVVLMPGHLYLFRGSAKVRKIRLKRTTCPVHIGGFH